MNAYYLPLVAPFLVALGVPVLAQGSGPAGGACADRGVKFVPPDADDSDEGKHCASFRIYILGYPTIGLEGEWCPEYKYHTPGHSVCGGFKDDTNCVADGYVEIAMQKCSCSKLGLGAFSIPLPFCDCEDVGDGGGHKPKYKEEPCTSV